MVRRIRSTSLTLGLILAIAGIAMLIFVEVASAHSTRKYAWANIYRTSYFNGIKGDLETAIPSVSDGPTGYSSEIMWITPATTAGTVEVGWRTMESPYQNPRWYSACFDQSGNWYAVWEGNPTVGNAYPYKIEKNSSGTWDIYINGSFKRSFNSGMTVGSVVQAGGEVTKLNSAVNAMGVSGFLDMQFKRASNGVWYLWATWDNTHVDSADGYSLVRLSGNYNDFQNYGNNP